MKGSAKKSVLVPVSNVLQAVLGNGKSPLSHQFIRWRLWRFWPEVVGETVASYSRPVGYDRGALVIWVQNSVQMQEMLFLRQQIRDSVNRYLGQNYVHRISLTLDDRSVPRLEETAGGLRDFLSTEPPNADEEPSPDR